MPHKVNTTSRMSNGYSYLDMCRLLESLSTAIELSDKLGMKELGELSSFMFDLEKSVGNMSEVNEREYLSITLASVKLRLSNIADARVGGASKNVEPEPEADSALVRPAKNSKSKAKHAVEIHDGSSYGSSSNKSSSSNNNNNNNNNKNNSRISHNNSRSSNNIDKNTTDIGESDAKPSSTIDELLVSSNEMQRLEQIERQDQERIAKEKLLEELATLVSELKDQSLTNHKVVKQQNVQLEKIDKRLDSNSDAINEMTEKMEKQVQEETASIWETLTIVLCLTLLFVFTFIIMKLFPKPSS